MSATSTYIIPNGQVEEAEDSNQGKSFISFHSIYKEEKMFVDWMEEVHLN